MTTFNDLAYGGTRGAPTPDVGMGATILHYTDRSPATIIDVERFKTGARAGEVKAITVQVDDATRVDSNGMSDAQTWVFAPNPRGATRRATIRKDGAFRTPGGTQIRVGDRSRYYDFSF